MKRLFWITYLLACLAINTLDQWQERIRRFFNHRH